MHDPQKKIYYAKASGKREYYTYHMVAETQDKLIETQFIDTQKIRFKQQVSGF